MLKLRSIEMGNEHPEGQDNGTAAPSPEGQGSGKAAARRLPEVLYQHLRASSSM